MAVADPTCCCGQGDTNSVAGDTPLAFFLSSQDPPVQPQLYGAHSRGGEQTEVLTPHGDLTAKIHAFNNQREEERERVYHAVIRVFLVTLICGPPLFIASIVLEVVLDQLYIAKIVAVFGYISTASSIVILSTCPHELLSIDDLAMKRPWLFAGFSIALSLTPAMRIHTKFPHLDVLLVLDCVATAFSVLARRRLPLCWPATTTLMTCYLFVMLVAWGCQFLFPDRNNMELPHPVAYSIGCYYFLSATFVLVTWQLRLRFTSDRKVSRGMAFYEAVYTCVVAVGVSKSAQGVAILLWDDPLHGILEIVIGLSLVTPPLVLLLIGRTRLFNILGHRFDKDDARLRRDGAFIAELLDNIPVNVGQLWWIHREVEDERYGPADPRRRWQQGHVAEVVNESEILVQLPEEGPSNSEIDAPPWASLRGRLSRSGSRLGKAFSLAGTVRVQFPSSSNGGKCKETLLLQAKENLRCVDFESLTPDLMIRVDSKNSPELQAKWHGLSRRVRAGETIDYFMSNSWYDNPDKKWQKLCEVADNHLKRYGRYPTIWLDKLCIDQTSITDGLKVLPVNVMACSKLLALCGDTYLSRLWCIWELFTLFAFVTEAAALDRIEFVFLGDHEEGIQMLKKMSNFHVKDSHCYDPNEEARLRQVIAAVGTERFNQRIASLAALTCARLEQQQDRGSKRRLVSGPLGCRARMSFPKLTSDCSTSSAVSENSTIMEGVIV